MGRQAVWLLGLDGCESGSFSESGSVCIGMHAAGALAGQTGIVVLDSLFR